MLLVRSSLRLDLRLPLTVACGARATIMVVMRFWTVDEARRYLPRLRELVGTVRRSMEPRSNGHGPPREDEVAAALLELEEGNIVLRDPAVGLVDFHALGEDGVVYLLCYRMDEEDLEWWHRPEDGFGGRRPLPREPEI
jgi:hypothetical protein